MNKKPNKQNKKNKQKSKYTTVKINLKIKKTKKNKWIK